MSSRFLLLTLALTGCSLTEHDPDPATEPRASFAASTEWPLLDVGPILPGSPVRVAVRNGPPGGTLQLVSSTAGEGAGPCPPPAGGECFDVQPPLGMPGGIPLDAQGEADTMIGLMPQPTGTSVWLQGMIVDGANSITTPVVATDYIGPGASCVGLGGTLSSDLTLTAADGECTLSSDLVVSPGVTLTLREGATLLADAGVELEIKGHLEVEGNAAAQVRIGSSASSPAAGDWQGLAFRETGTGDIRGAIISHASTGIYAEGIAPTVADTVVHSSTTGLSYDSVGSATITGSTLSNNDVGLYASWSTVTVDDSSIQRNRIGAQGGSASTLDIANSTITQNSEIGIEPDGGTIEHNTIAGNGVGVQTTTGWNTLSYNLIAGNDVGVVLGGYPVRKTLSYNHLLSNSTAAVRYDGGYDDGTIDAEHNWWGSSDLAVIDAAVYDVYDDIDLFQVDVVPPLSGPHPGVGPVPVGWEDADGDGYASIASGGNDCDDSDASASPEGLDTSADGIDSDCDGSIDEDVTSDLDGDGYQDDVDCDDLDPSVFPGASELPANGIDEDCNGFDLEAPASSTLSGVLVGDVLLSAADSPYTVSADIAVAPERTLQIEPGVELLFDAGTELLVKGRMNADGSAGSEIQLGSSAASPAAGDWSGVFFQGGSEGSWSNLEVRHAATALDVDDAGPSLDAITFEKNQTGLQIYGQSITLENSSLLDNEVGATVSWATLTLRDSIVSSNGTGLDGGSASTLDVYNTRIDRNDVGIHPDGGTVDHCDIQGNGIGIDTGTGWFTLSYSDVQENAIGVVLGGYPTRKVMNWNTFDGNTDYSVQYVGGYSEGEVDATHNYWGSVQRIIIDTHIYDVLDDIDLFEVVYEPFLTEAHLGTGLIPAGTVDADGDGYDDVATGGNDCDDSDPSIKPEGLDDTADGIDQDCDGLVDDDVPVDADGDGYLDDVDCDDSNPDVFPDQPEIARNGVDEDCNGSDLADPTGSVSGVLSTDTILSAAGGPWLFGADVAVPPGVTLLLEAGAELAFAAGTRFRVKGRLLSEGTAADTVWIGADGSTSPGHWTGLSAEGTQAEIDLQSTILQHANTGLEVDEGSAWLTDCELSDHLTGLYAYDPGALLLSNSTLARSDVGGSISWGTLEMLGGVVEDCSTGLDGGSASSLDLDGVVVRNNDVGLHPDGGDIRYSRIEGNDVGIDTGTGWITMSHLEILNNRDGLVLGGYPIRKTLNASNLEDNTDYAVRYVGGYDDGNVDCTGNWWGSTDPAMIEAAVWDFDDDPALFPVDVDPVLSTPEPSAGP